MFKLCFRGSSHTHNLYSEGNLLQLTNALKFRDTTTIPGSRHIPAVRSRGFLAQSYFSGYVFRGDTRPPDIIFEQGFMLQHPVKSMDQVLMMTGLSHYARCRGYTGSEGISTSVSVDNASYYTASRRGSEIRGYVYLIDAMDMAGFAVSETPDVFWEPPSLEVKNEVCFLSPIPNTSVVGVVWPEGFRPLTFIWPDVTAKLNLAVNPEYWSGCEKGLAAAKKVVELFNT